jgi:hypothetical protein
MGALAFIDKRILRTLDPSPLADYLGACPLTLKHIVRFLPRGAFKK